MNKKANIGKFIRQNAAGYAFLTPWLLGFFILTLYPMIYSLWLGFTNYDFTMPNSTEWIGIGNYVKIFGPMFGLSDFTASNGELIRVDPYYLKSLSVTFTYAFVSVALKLIFALAVAVCSTLRYFIPSIFIFRAGHTTKWVMHRLWPGCCCS